MTNPTTPRAQFIQFLTARAPADLAVKFRLHTLPTLESHAGRQCREFYTLADVAEAKRKSNEILHTHWYKWLERSSQQEISQLLGYLLKFVERNETDERQDSRQTSAPPQSFGAYKDDAIAPSASGITQTSPAPHSSHESTLVEEPNEDVNLSDDNVGHANGKEEDADLDQIDKQADASNQEQEHEQTDDDASAPQLNVSQDAADNSPIIAEEAFRVWLAIRFSEKFAQRVVKTIHTIDEAIDSAFRYQYHGYQWRNNKPNFFNISAYELLNKISWVGKTTFSAYVFYSYSYSHLRTRSGDLRFWFDRYVTYYSSVDEDEIYDCEASLNLLEDYTNFAKLHEQRDLDYYSEDNLDDLEDRYMSPYFEHELSRGVVTLDLFDKKSYTYGVPKRFIYYGLEETNNISDWSKLFQAFCHRFYRVDPQAFSDCCDKFASSASPWIRRIEKKDRRFALSTKDYQMKNAKNVGGRYAVDVGLSWKRLFDAMRALFECRTIDVPLVIEYEERDELSELEKLEAILNRPQKKRVIKISSRHDLYRTTVKRLTVFHALENVDILPVSTRYDDGAVAKIDPHSWSRFVAATCSTLFQHMGPSISNANVQLKLGSLISFNSDGYGGYPKVETTDLFVDVSKLSTCKAALKFACDAIAKLGLSEDEFIIDFQTQDANSLSDDFLNLSEEEMTTYFPHLAALDQTQQDEEEDVEEEEEDDHSGALDALSDADFEEEDEEDEEYDLLSQERDAQTQNNVAVQVDAQSPAQFQEQNACLDVDAEPTRHDATRFSLDIPVGQGLLDTTPRDQIRNALSGSSYNPLLINRDLDKSVSPADNRHAHSDNTANSHVADAYNSSQSHNPLAIKAPRYSMPDALEEFDENPYNPLAIQSPSRKRQEEDVDLPDVTPSADLHIESQFDPLAETLTQPAPSDDFLIPNAPVAERPDSRQDLVAAVDTAESESDSYEDELLEKEPRQIVEAPFNLARFEDWLRAHRRLLARGRDRTIDQLRLFESRFLNKLDVFTTQTLLSGELHAIAKTLQRLLAKDEYKRYVYKAVKSYHTELEKLLNFLHEEIARVDDPNYVPEQLPQETDDAELEQQQSLSTDDSLATDLLNDLAESEATLEEEALPIVETPFDLQRFTAWLESRRKRSAHGRDKTIDQLRFFDSRFLSRRDDFPTQTVLSGELHALAQTIKRCLAKDAYNRYVYREVKSYRVELGKLLCFLNEEIARVDDPNYQPESQDLNVELTDAELEQRQELQDAQPIDSNVGDAGNEVENAPANDAANAPQTPCPEAKENDDAQVVAPTNLNATSPEPTSAPKQYAPLAFNLRDFRDYLQNDLRLAASDKSSVIMALRQVEKFTPFRKRALPAKSLLDGDLHAIARTVQLLIQDERFLKAVPIGGDLCKRYLTYLLDFCEHVRATAEVSDVQNVSEEPSTVEKAQDAIGTTQVIESNEVADSVPVESHDEIQSNSPTEPHRSSSTIHSLGQEIFSRKELTTSQENDAFVKFSQTKAIYAGVLERAKERVPIPFSLFGFRVYLGRIARLNRNDRDNFVSRLREIEKSKPFRKRSLPSKKLREGDLYSIALTAQSLLEDATFLKELPFGYKDSERSLTYLYGYCVSELATKEAYPTQGRDNRQNTVATPLGTIESVEENAPQNITDANTQLDNKLEETTAQIESNDEPEKTPKEPTPQEVADSANEPEVVEEDSAPQEAVEANEVEHITGDVNDVNSVSANEPIFDRDDFLRWQTETMQYTSITASYNCVRLEFIEKRCLKTPSQSSSGQLLCGSLRGILRTIDALRKDDALSERHGDLEKLNLLKRYVEEKLAQTPTITEVASQDQALEEQTPMDEKNQIKTEITQVEEQSASEEPEQDQDVARKSAQEPIGAQVKGAQEAPNATECANVEPPLPSGRLQDFAHWLASSRGYPQAKINQVRAALSSVDKALALAEYASDHNLHATLDAGEIPAIQALVECVQNDKTMCAYLDSIDRRHAQTLSLYGKYLATLAEARNQAHSARQCDASAPEEPSAQEVDVTPANATPQEDAPAQREHNNSEALQFDRELAKWLQTAPKYEVISSKGLIDRCIYLIRALETQAVNANLPYQKIRTFDTIVSVQTIIAIKSQPCYQRKGHYELVLGMVKDFHSAYAQRQERIMTRLNPAPGNEFINFNALKYETHGKPVRLYLYNNKVDVRNWLDVYLYVVTMLWKNSKLSADAFYAQYRAIVSLKPQDPQANPKYNKPVLGGAYLIDLEKLTVSNALKCIKALLDATKTPYDRVVIEFTPPLTHVEAKSAKNESSTPSATAEPSSDAKTPEAPKPVPENKFVDYNAAEQASERTLEPQPQRQVEDANPTPPEPAPGTRRVNFYGSNDVIFCKLVRAVMFGKEVYVQNWSDVLKETIEAIYRHSGMSANQFASQIQHVVNIAPTSMSNSIRRGMPVLDGEYVIDVNYNANAILKKIQSVVFATRSMDNIVIEYRPNDARAESNTPQEARVARVEEPSSRRVPSLKGQDRLDKVVWIQWMTQSLDIKESTAKRCQTELTRIAGFAEANGLFAADLFSNDLTRTKEIVEQIKALPKYKSFNIECHRRPRAALNYLIQYLESGINGTYAATSQTPTQQDFTGDYFPETPDLPEGARRVDFKNLNIGNGTKLIQAFLFGYLFKVKYWRDLYALAINEIWKQTAMDLHEYANIVRRFTRLTPAGEPNRYPKPQLILDDEYSLDVNFTVVNMLERLRDILDAFNLPFGNVAIDYTYWGTGAQSNDATASEYDVAPTVAPTPVASRLTDSGVPVEEFVNSQRRLDAVREVMRSRYSTGGLRVFGNAFESFKDMYAELTGESVTEDDAKLLLDKVCVYNDDYYYYVSEDMRQELSQTVRDAFAFCGVVYFVPLFNKHFMHESKWNFLTQELMVQLIREQFPLLRYEERFMTNDPERTVSELIQEKLEELFSNEPYQKVDQLATDLPYIPKLTIQTSCSTFQKVVADNKGTYIWLDGLQFDMDEVERTRHDLAQWLQNHEAASVRHIIAERTAELNMVGLLIARNAIYLKFLSDEYDKSNGLIFHAGAKIKPDNLVKSYCEEIEETVEVDTLEAFREEMAIPKDRFDSNIHEWLFKLSEKLFAPVWMIQFSPQVVQRVDEIIAAFTQNSVIALKDVSSFTSFPYVENLTWNRYSLGSYVYRVSKAFKLLTPSQGTSKQDRGVIVSRSNTELTYDDALAHMLLRAGVELTDDAVNEYLVEHGLRLRRGGSQEDLIRRVQNLKAQRENKRE